MVVKILMKQISLNSIRVILEVCVIKNPTRFSRWNVREMVEKGYIGKDAIDIEWLVDNKVIGKE